MLPKRRDSFTYMKAKNKLAIDFLKIQKELIRTLRGKRSQAQVNLKMNFSTNQMYRWESGQANISWIDFCNLCEVLKKPIHDACEEGFAFRASPLDVTKLVQHLIGPRTQKELQSTLGISRSKISRWQNKKVSLSLIQVLQLADGGPCSLHSFFKVLIGNNLTPTLRHLTELEEKEKEIHFIFPWTGAFLLCLLLPSYKALKKHKEGFIAKKIGITLEQERLTLKKLLEVHAVYETQGLYKARLNTITTSGSLEGRVALRKFWTEKSLALLPSAVKKKTTVWPYLVFNTDPKTYEKIQKLLVNFFAEISKLSLEGEDSEGIYIFNAQLLSVLENSDFI